MTIYERSRNLQKNEVFVLYGINSGKYGKGYVKMSPAEHNKIFNSILLRSKITKCTQNKQDATAGK
ncbi:MAG: hypothetical protein LBN01_01920 [Endomicrobium sp.]|nr:hypothetical protein [Endomicrobium sp.]